MKYKLLFIVMLVFMFTTNIYADGPEPGYSDWSTEQSGNENEIKRTQYGRKIPKEWSEPSESKPGGLNWRSFEGNVKRYAHTTNGRTFLWYNASEKNLYTWYLSSESRVIYAYIDVDTWRSYDEAYYEGPVMRLYCDNVLVAQTERHDVLKNWNPDIDCRCNTLRLDMSDNNSNGRNRTAIVGTWITTISTLYQYPISWMVDESAWRFYTPYKRKYGSEPQYEISRKLYSYPLKYSINYELDGGTPTGDLTYNYTVLDKVTLPTCKKIGYDFLGYYDSNGRLYSEIKKGTYGNLTLYAKYKRRLPSLYVGYTYFDIQDTNISSSEVIERTNARAIDELEGDLTKNIVIKSITYENKNKTVNNPEYLELDSEDVVSVTYQVSNNVGGTAEVTRKFYILGKGKNNEEYTDNIEIYSRYIDKEYLYTLDEYSIWNTSDYKDQLYKAFSFMEEE